MAAQLRAADDEQDERGRGEAQRDDAERTGLRHEEHRDGGAELDGEPARDHQRDRGERRPAPSAGGAALFTEGGDRLGDGDCGGRLCGGALVVHLWPVLLGSEVTVMKLVRE